MTERGKMWQAELNGKPIDLERVWPACTKDPIDERTYRYMADSHDYAVRNAPFDPRAMPHKATDWDSAPPPKF